MPTSKATRRNKPFLPRGCCDDLHDSVDGGRAQPDGAPPLGVGAPADSHCDRGHAAAVGDSDRAGRPRAHSKPLRADALAEPRRGQRPRYTCA